MSEWTNLLLAFYQSWFLSLSWFQCHFCNRFPGSLCFTFCFFPQPNKAFLFFTPVSFCGSRLGGLVLVCALSAITKDCLSLYKLLCFPKLFLCMTYQCARRWAVSPLSARQRQGGSSLGRCTSHCHQTAASRGWWRHHTAQGSRPRPPGPWNVHSWVWRDPCGSRRPWEEK